MPKLVTAVVKPHKLEEVKEAVRAAGIAGMTVTEVKGFGRQGGKTETYRGAEYTVEFLPKVKVEVLCLNEDVDAVVSAITASASSGKIGDGKVWVTSVESIVRIRTGEAGPDAL